MLASMLPVPSEEEPEKKGKSSRVKAAFPPSLKYLVKSADVGRESVVVTVNITPGLHPSALHAFKVNS